MELAGLERLIPAVRQKWSYGPVKAAKILSVQLSEGVVGHAADGG
jgi:hypothetical protein